MARKPLSESTVAQNVLKYGTGGINIDESRVESNEENRRTVGGFTSKSDIFHNDKKYKINTMETNDPQGRFPANLIHDNSEEVRECFPETKPTKPHGGDGGKLDTQEMGWGFKRMPCDLSDNGGNASRFFKSIIYQAKSSKSERNRGCEGLEKKEIKHGLHSTSYIGEKEYKTHTIGKNTHPCIKPIALMEYLIKMVTRKGGTVLDPFAGSFSTGVACVKNGFNFIGIELESEYIKIGTARMEQAKKEYEEKNKQQVLL